MVISNSRSFRHSVHILFSRLPSVNVFTGGERGQGLGFKVSTVGFILPFPDCCSWIVSVINMAS